MLKNAHSEMLLKGQETIMKKEEQIDLGRGKGDSIEIEIAIEKERGIIEVQEKILIEITGGGI